MFLAAAPYFQTRFQDNERILTHFQSSIISVSCVTNLSAMLVLSNMQSRASYPKRIMSSLIVNTIVFILLTISTSYFRHISSAAYFVFTLIMVFLTSIATGLCQNGTFAFAASFGRPEYIQAIMTGQAVAGVLPSIAQILSVLAVPEPDRWNNITSEAAVPSNENTLSAFIYFLTATAVSSVTILALIPLVLKQKRELERQIMSSVTSIEELERTKRKVVSMRTLYRKLNWLSPTIFTCFLITMFFPVFTQKVVSVIPTDQAPRLLQPATFIPLGFLVWNSADLFGRLLTLLRFTSSPWPIVLFICALLRAGFIPLYLLCNIEGKGAIVKSDAFYLFVVQFGFGVTNGFLGSTTMITARKYVDQAEQEATGGFMALNLVAGLTAGSLLSFSISGIS
jgi:equilibrative nucleoside transporter 1/2/3